MTAKPTRKSAPERTGLAKAIRPATVLWLSAAAIGLFAYGITLLPRAEFDSFDINSYRKNLARQQSPSLRSIIARQIGADGLTPRGVAGRVGYEPESGLLVMSIEDYHGTPVEDAHVRAVIKRPNGPTGPEFMLPINRDKRYSAEMKSFGSGRWDVSVTAIDPKVSSGSGLIFRIEKDIRIE